MPDAQIKIPEKFRDSFVTFDAVFEIRRAVSCREARRSIVPLAGRKIKMARKVTLRVTTIRQRVIQTHEALERHYCRLCQREVEMLTERDAEQLLGVDDRTLSDLIAKNRVHAITVVSGIRRVCRESVVVRSPSALVLRDT